MKKFSDTIQAAPTVATEILSRDVMAGPECGSEDRQTVGDGDSVLNQQTQEFQRLQIDSNHEQVIMNRKIIEAKSRIAGEYNAQSNPEKVMPAAAPVGVPVQMPISAAYLQERRMASTGYPMASIGTKQPSYQIPTIAGVYQAHALRPMPAQPSQGYYGVQRLVQVGYREQPVYNAGPPPTAASLQQNQQVNVGVYTEGIGMMQPKVGVNEQGYVQVGYDSAGRQVIYTTTCQVSDGRPGYGALNQDGNVFAANSSSV